MTRQIILAEIGLGFDNSPRGHSLWPAALEDCAEEIACDIFGGPVVKGGWQRLGPNSAPRGVRGR